MPTQVPTDESDGLAVAPLRHLTRLRLENFQGHKDTDIPLSPGINLVTGTSNAGKSAILRAIHFVLHNQPRGAKFIRYGAQETKVTLWFSDGTVVQRIKGDQNTVLLQLPDGTGQKFDRFGNDLPDQVLEALGFPPQDERHGALSYAEQMSPLFLVSLGPSDLPRSISELTGIEDFQIAAEDLGKRSRQIERQMKDAQIRIDRFDAQLEAYDRLDKQIANLEALQGNADGIAAIAQRETNAQLLLDRWRESNRAARAEQLAYERAMRMAALADRLQPVMEIGDRAQAARRMIVDWGSVETEILEAENAIYQGRALLSPRRLQLMEQSQTLQRQMEAARTWGQDYQEWLATGQSLRKEYDSWKATLSTLEEERAELVASLQEQGLWCPTCNRPLGGEVNG